MKALDRNQFNIHVNYEDPFLTENELPQYRLTSGIGVSQQHDHKELEKQLELLESIDAAHEKDKKELEALIAKMNAMLSEIEEANKKAKKEEPMESPSNTDSKEKSVEKSEEKEKDPGTEKNKVEDEKVTPVLVPNPVVNQSCKYYVIISSLKDENLGREYQQVLEREYNFTTDIISNEKGSWYFIYMHASDDLQSCKQELRRVKDLRNQKYIQGSPWIYAK